MNVVRDVEKFNGCLAEIRELSAEWYSKREDQNIELPASEKALVEQFIEGKIKYNDLTKDAAMYCSLQSLQDQRKNPYPYSRLQQTLELETWSPKDALMILAGIDPYAAIFDWHYENFMGATVHEPVIRHAACFSDRSDLYDYPVEADFGLSASELRLRIRSAEKDGTTAKDYAKLSEDLAGVERWSKDEASIFKTRMLSLRAAMLGVLKRRWDSGEHDTERRQSPVYFVRWAEKRGFVVEWVEWARQHGLLGEGESAETPPYFDADSEDYPEALHIAVAAWEHARKSTGGTPKQRVIAYVMSRFPQISEGTREAIGTVANWQKTGGRPRTGG